MVPMGSCGGVEIPPVIVILRGELIVAPVSTDLAATLNENAPGVAAMPLSRPAELNERPGGSEPLDVHV